MESRLKENQRELEQLREEACNRLPRRRDSRAAKDVRLLRDLWTEVKEDDNAVVWFLRGKWHAASDEVFYTRLAMAMWRAGWSYNRRYHALKTAGADDLEILRAYGDWDALSANLEKKAHRLDEFEALSEGLRTLAECGDDVTIVNALYEELEDDAEMLKALEDILGWTEDGTTDRVANALWFGLGWDRAEIRWAWRHLDELRQLAIDEAMSTDEEPSS